MAFIIPVNQRISSKFTQQVNLENNLVRLSFNWSTRAGIWYMDIEVDNELLRRNALVKNWIIPNQTASNLPALQGKFILLGKGDITYTSLGNELVLYYLTAEEVQRWKDFYGI